MKLPVVIDCNYVAPNCAASFLIKEGEKASFVETNTAHAVPLLLRSLHEQNLGVKDVEFVIITHVHLDHAGGCSELIRHCPNATLLAHPKAAKHLIDPSRLVRSARKVYGDQKFIDLYGEILPISSNRVRSPEDGESIQFGKRKLTFFYTRGHANHHFCIHDAQSNAIFTGDSFGLAYPILQSKGLFIFPSTSPTDFDPVQAKTSILKILGMKPACLYLTHFGIVTEVQLAADQLLTHLDFSEQLLDRAVSSSLPDSELLTFCLADLRDYFSQILESRGLGSDFNVWSALEVDIKLNASGIAYSAQQIRKGKS